MSAATLPSRIDDSPNPGDYILVDPARLGGEPVFRRTRVPVKTLFDYLRAGDPLDVFFDHFHGVQREQAEAVVGLAGRGLLDRVIKDCRCPSIVPSIRPAISARDFSDSANR